MKNSECYSDPTAYIAIYNITKKERMLSRQKSKNKNKKQENTKCET